MISNRASGKRRRTSAAASISTSWPLSRPEVRDDDDLAQRRACDARGAKRHEVEAVRDDRDLARAARARGGADRADAREFATTFVAHA